MYTNFYTLPEISFVGGATQILKFNLKDDTGEAFDLSNCTVDFSISDYSIRNSTAIVTLTPTKSSSMITVTIPATDTVGLSGKYIYQISIYDADGSEFQIPNQGLMHIAGNVNPAFISDHSGA